MAEQPYQIPGELVSESEEQAADLPVGTSLKIVIKGGKWAYVALPDAPVNWNITTYDNVARMQTFTAVENGKSCDLKILFTEPQIGDDLTIEYYENGALSPTRIKHMILTDTDGQTVEPPEVDTARYPVSTETGLNILSPSNDTFYIDTTYAMAFNAEWGDSIEIILEGGTWEYEIIPAIQDCWFIYDYNSFNKSQSFKFNMPMEEGTEIRFRFTGTDYQQEIMIYYREYYSGELYEWSRPVIVRLF